MSVKTEQQKSLTRTNMGVGTTNTLIHKDNKNYEKNARHSLQSAWNVAFFEERIVNFSKQKTLLIAILSSTK